MHGKYVLYRCTKIYLSFHQWLGHLGFSSFWRVWIKLSQLLCTGFCVSVSFHFICMCNFIRNCQTVFQNYWSSLYSHGNIWEFATHLHQHVVGWLICFYEFVDLLISHSTKYVALSNCGFNFHFLDDWWESAPSFESLTGLHFFQKATVLTL